MANRRARDNQREVGHEQSWTGATRRKIDAHFQQMPERYFETFGAEAVADPSAA